MSPACRARYNPVMHSVPRPTGGQDPSAGAVSLTVARLTPSGRGALAVVAIDGVGATDLVDRLFQSRSGRTVASREDGEIAVGRWHAAPGRVGEELVVVRRQADRLEVHCHGGLAASEAIVASLTAAGARRLEWQEWLDRAVDAESVREAWKLLPRATGPRAARILTRQLDGRLDTEFERVAALVADAHPRAATELDRLLRAARVGLRLAEPWRVALLGPVNAGKSSLVNALAGHARSLVSAVPGTTRDLLETRIALDGWSVVLIDTAGTRPVDDPGGSSTERAGIERAWAAASRADLVIRLAAVDAPPPVGPWHRSGLVTSEAFDELEVLSKCDRIECGGHEPRALRTSAVTGDGLAALTEAIVERLVPETRDDASLLDGPVPFTARQVAFLSELRAKVAVSG